MAAWHTRSQTHVTLRRQRDDDYTPRSMCVHPRERQPRCMTTVDYYWSKARSQRVYSRISLVKVPEGFYPRSPGD